MKLIDIKRVCILHQKKGCKTCPGYQNGKCMFGSKPPGLWTSEEISAYVEKLRGGSNAKTK